MNWTICYTGQARKAIKEGSGLLSQEARLSLNALHLDLEELGPTLGSWPHYSKLKNLKNYKKRDIRHCHLLKGRPTYVACWEVKDKKDKLLEVFYAGTHEKAPY